MPATECRYFNGYKPCGKSSECHDQCPSHNVPSARILLIHLGAIGAIVRSTALLNAIHRKFPGCHLIWVTDAPSHQLLQNHPLIDQVLVTSENDLLELSVLEFDFALVVDKSRKASAVLKKTKADQVFGFITEPRTGAIHPATPAAQELWEIGLSDQKKFFQNLKTEIQLVHESLDLGSYRHDDYNLPLTLEEKSLSLKRKQSWTQNSNQVTIGINTGASPTIPYKKLSIQNHRDLITLLLKNGYQNIILLGGPEDTERNKSIADNFPIQQSPTLQGLRDGLVSVAACDIVITGDSLGMHMAIATQKYVIAWFGPTCAHEIELFGRGEAILTKAPCAPCWKRLCHQQTLCYDLVDLNEIVAAISRGEKFWNQQVQEPPVSPIQQIIPAL